MDDPTCWQTSFDAGESMAGTVPYVSRTLIVEQPGPWGRDAVETSRLPEPLREELLTWQAQDEDTKVRLARHPSRTKLSGSRSLWLFARADTGWAGTHISCSTETPLTEQHLDSRTPTSPEDLPIFVCTNGARDRCCAQNGREIMRKVGIRPDLWEVSHIGGHRFSPTALRGSDGVVFGRLDPATLETVLAGGTPLDYVRGRSGLKPFQSAAELTMAATTGWDLPALHTSGPPQAVVVTAGHEFRQLEMAPENVEPIRISCGDDLGPAQHWSVASGGAG